MADPRILPADRYLAAVLGLSDEQYAYFQAEARKRCREQPAPAVVAGTGLEVLLYVSIAASLLSVGLTIAASFFKPRPGKPSQLVQRDRSLANITQNQRFAPRYGFDASQDVVGLGTTIPLVYALRETISGNSFGGVRVNTPLLWSQIWSLGSSQMLRAVFLLGEGRLDSIDTQGFAIGNNSLGVYDLLSNTANERASRLTVYHRDNGGRLSSGNRVSGRTAARDPGNAQQSGAGDVFQLQSVNNSYAPDFCSVNRPSAGTTFGVYNPCGNNLGYKLNPIIRPATRARLKPRGSKGNSTLQCDPDPTALVQRLKFEAFYSTRSGFTSGGNTASLDEVITYRLDRSCEPLDDPFLVDVNDDSVGSWSSDYGRESRTRIYERDNANKEINVAWNRLVSVSNPSVGSGGDTIEVTATFDYETPLLSSNSESLLERLGPAARGQYETVYWVKIKRGKEEIESQFSVFISKQSKRKFKATNDTSGSSFKDYTLSTGTNDDGAITSVSLNPSSSNSLSVTTVIDDDEIEDFYDFDLEVDDDSGPVEFLTSPLRLRAKIVFPVKELEAFSENARDVATAVASRQQSWNDAVVVGDLYKIGSALAVCTSKSPSDAVFISDIDQEQADSGTTITADFRVVRAGQMASYNNSTLRRNGKDSKEGLTATNAPHLMKCAVATFVTSRRCRVVEIGLRSTVGLRINGICNFRDCPTYEDVDGRACLFKEGDNVKRGKRVILEDFTSNTLTTSEERFSFFRISFRNPDSSSSFTELGPCFGVRGLNQQASFNYIRFVMPNNNHWEFRIEPLTGWEIRNDIASGGLRVLDASMASTISGSSNNVNWYSNGFTVSRSRSNFNLNASKRSGNIDSTLKRVDENNYIDAWGKLAEFFVYDAVESSAAGGPEHEVIYVNEIVRNSAAPQYDNLALVGLNIVSSSEWQQFSQFSTYVTGGLRCRRLRNSLSNGPSHLFPDVLLDLLTDSRYGRGDSIPDSLIDLASFEAAANWCHSRRYFFDGVIADRINLRQWAADVAATNLLIFGESDGQFYLRPALQFDAVSIKGLFTAGNISEGTFQVQMLDPEDREPVQVSVKYREERANNSINNPGVFPTERELLVREAGSSDTDPIEALDLSDYCTNRDHAIDAAKYLIRMRRIPTHTIKFQTTYEGVLARLAPSDYIQVVMDVTQYDEFNNGVVTAAGTLVSTKPLSNGSYSVIAWNGDNANPPATTTLVVSGGGATATPTGIVFTRTPNQVTKRTYQIERITPEEDGTFTIESVHMPTNSSGVLEVAAGFDTNSNWVIEG
jgi:hypothetical protein